MRKKTVVLFPCFLVLLLAGCTLAGGPADSGAPAVTGTPVPGLPSAPAPSSSPTPVPSPSPTPAPTPAPPAPPFILALAGSETYDACLWSNGMASLLQDKKDLYPDWTDLAQVVAGYNFMAGLRFDGSVAVADWGGQYGAAEADDWTGMTALSAGDYYLAGLRRDGTVAVTGGLAPGAADWSGIRGLAAGATCLIGFRADGSVATAPVRNSTLDVGQSRAREWSGITAVAAGRFHVAGLRADGTVAAAGYNGSGQCEVDGWRDIVAIAAGERFTAGLRADGTVVTTMSSGEQDPWICFDTSDWRQITALTAMGDGLAAMGTDGLFYSNSTYLQDKLNTGLTPPDPAGPFWNPGPAPTRKPDSTPGPSPTPAVPGEPAVFCGRDLYCAGIGLDWTIEEVEAVLGAPLETELYYQGAFGMESADCTYDGIHIRFEYLYNEIWTAAAISTSRPGDEGPRGIRIGDPVSRVLEAFYSESHAREEDRRPLYDINAGDDDPFGIYSGWIRYDDAGAITAVCYETGGGGFGTLFVSFSIENGLVSDIFIDVMNV